MDSSLLDRLPKAQYGGCFTDALPQGHGVQAFLYVATLIIRVLVRAQIVFYWCEPATCLSHLTTHLHNT